MIRIIDFNDFINGFQGSYKNCFSHEGKRTLFEYLENMEDETGETIEFDPIALCCEYREYDSFKDLQADYSDIKNIKELEDRTTVVKIHGTDKFLVQEF